MEKHHAHHFVDFSEGLLSNDGTTYVFPLEKAEAVGALSLDQLEASRDAAAALNNAFILWSAERQGLPVHPGFTRFQHPKDREYVIPSLAERQQIIRFLRGTSEEL
jgi:hypothetical protein